ncbi:MAG: hypothetical protein CSA75_02440 [Sorangium cellulosum]|nr:MAG: hypothetical protein CSA75_02440 [Sorangium cellulosum]
MARKPEATSKPPDIKVVDQHGGDPTSVDQDAMDEPDRPTALPPDAYETFVRNTSQASMTKEAARASFSSPRMPITEDNFKGRLGISGRESDKLEAPIPMLEQQPSGAYAIPLELDDDDGQQPRLSERPTTPQREPPPAFELDAGMKPTPETENFPNHGTWPDEARTPIFTNPAMVETLRVAGDNAPSIHEGPVAQDSNVSFDEGKITLDEPDGILMEDSLELSLDNVPPAPFDLSPNIKSSTPQTEPDSLALPSENKGEALDLIDARTTPSVPKASEEGPLVDLRARYAVGDFTGAYEIAESILVGDPENTEALRFQESCRDVLIQMYTARLGSLTQVPRIAIPASELQWLSLNHRAGFLLSCVDGRYTVEEILDVSGMPALDALRMLYALLQQQIIEMAP